MTDPREQAIRDIEARLDAATPGPWEAHPEPDGVIPGWEIWMPEVGHDGALVEDESDADLIAHAPADIRLLLDMVEEQREEVERLTSWKAAALHVIGRWELVWDALGHPGQLGQERSTACVAEVERLTEEAAERVALSEYQAESYLAVYARAEAADARATAAEAALAEMRARVRGLHVRVAAPEHHKNASPAVCTRCWDQTRGAFAIWPCPTIALLDATGADQ